MAEQLPYSPPWRLEGGEVAEVKASVAIDVTFRWEVEQPVFKAWFGAVRPTAWTWLTIHGQRDAAVDDLRIRGRGWTVKKDGTIGVQLNEGTFRRLADLPSVLADQMLDEWLHAAIRAGRAGGR